MYIIKIGSLENVRGGSKSAQFDMPTKSMSSQFIKKNYPEVYAEIYNRGMRCVRNRDAVKRRRAMFAQIGREISRGDIVNGMIF